MRSTEPDSVRAIAGRYREAIRDAAPEMGIVFARFPHGSCSESAILLGEHLAEAGRDGWLYQCGTRTDRHTHAWLECRGWILDITADQFEGVDSPVLLTRHRGFHDLFVPTSPPRPARVDIWDRSYQRELRRLASLISCRLR